jgi:hypothetical protein
VILGCEMPRVFTAPRRELTPETSHGFAAIAFADLLGIRLFPWQRWVLIHALELNEDKSYRFRYVLVLVARQSGKTMLMIILALWHIYALDSPTVIGTAQDLANAEKAWGEAVEWAQSDEELAELIDKINLGHPKILRLVTGCQYRVAAASRKGARGFSGDLILLDELREHQSWDSWGAVTNTMNARPAAQAWAFSNAGDALSVVLRYLRALAHKSLSWPDGDADSAVLQALDEETEAYLAEQDDDAFALFEYSAPPGAKRTDWGALAQANPSLNHTDVVANCVTERALRAALRTSPPAVYDTEVMCRWLDTADGGPWPEGSWVDTADASARPAGGAESAVCVAVSWNRQRAYIARAAKDDAGNPVAGIAADRPGTDWVVDWLVEHRADFAAVVVQSNGAPETSLIDDIENAVLPGDIGAELPLVKWAGADLGAAHGVVFDRLDTRRIRHLPHPGLDAAATTATPKQLSQGAWVIDLARSINDAAPLKAFVGAVWAAETMPTDMYSIYEHEDVLVL